MVRRAARDAKGLTTVRRPGPLRSQASTIDLILPGIEVAAGLRRTGGNRKRYETLLRKFAEQQAAQSRRYEARLSAGDAATAERAAHSLKGAAGHARRYFTFGGRRPRPRPRSRGGIALTRPVRLPFAIPGCRAGQFRTALPEDRSDNGAAPRSAIPPGSRSPLIRLKQLLATDDGEAADFIIDAQPRSCWRANAHRDEDAQRSRRQFRFRRGPQMPFRHRLALVYRSGR